MRRTVMTALLSASSSTKASKTITLVLMPDLREQVTYKNTVACSVSEIKAFVAEVIKDYEIDENCF